jgi:hypothetical protein
MNSTTGNQEQVAIYSDEPILAAGFESVIATDPELELTGCCSTVAELKEHLSYTRPELAVVDVTPEITSSMLLDSHRVSRARTNRRRGLVDCGSYPAAWLFSLDAHSDDVDRILLRWGRQDTQP